MNFTDEQIEYIKNASDHVEMLCGGRRNGKIYQLINEMQNKIRNQQYRINTAINFINSKHNWYGDEEEDNEDYLFELEDFESLLNILKGE